MSTPARDAAPAQPRVLVVDDDPTICLLAGVREKLRFADPPEGLRGLGLDFIVVGLLSLAFIGFAGIELP